MTGQAQRLIAALRIRVYCDEQYTRVRQACGCQAAATWYPGGLLPPQLLR